MYNRCLFILTCCCCLIQNIAIAQEYTGIVIDELTSEAIPFADVYTVSVENTILASESTDLDGKFSIRIENKTESIIIRMLGYDNDTVPVAQLTSSNLGTIKLKSSSVLLDGVEITSRKSLFSVSGGTLTFNVGSYELGKTGNVSEILTKAPGVSTDASGNLSFRGRAGVQVLINGKNKGISGEQLQAYLSSIPGDNIERIELTSTPKSSYDASGSAGVINIVLKKSEYLGLNGSFTTSLNRANFFKENASTHMNYRFSENFNLYGNYSIRNGRSKITDNSDRNVLNVSTLDQVGGTETEYLSQSFGTGFDIDKNNHSINVYMNGVYNTSNNLSFADTEISSSQVDSIVNFNGDTDRKITNFSFGVKHKVTIDTTGGYFETNLDYYPSNFTSETNQSTLFFDPNMQLTAPEFLEKLETPSSIRLLAGSLDFLKKTKLGEFDAGWKTSVAHSDNEILFYEMHEEGWVNQTNRSNQFIFDETIHAAYAGLEWGAKGLDIYTGLRAEHSISKGNSVTIDSTFKNDVFKVFPYISVSKNYTGGSISAAYSRRIDRPVYSQLNPFVYFVDRFSYWQGNVNLRPMLSESFSLSHVYKNWITTSINYTHTTDLFNRLPVQDDETGVIYNTTHNIGTSNYYGLTITANRPIKPWWYSYSTFGMYHTSTTDTRETEMNPSTVSGTQYFFNTFNSFALPKSYSMELSARIVSSVESFWNMKGFYAVNANISKRFSNNSKLTFSINDIFNTTVYDQESTYSNLDIRSYYKPETRTASITYTMPFGKPKARLSKKRSTGIEDEKKRIQF